MGDFDFSSPVPSRGTGDVIDELASAAQRLQRELGASAVSVTQIESLLASIPNPVALLDLGGAISATNEPMRTIMAATAEEGSRDFLAWLNEYQLESRVARIADVDAPVEVEYEHGGRLHHYLFSVASMVTHAEDVEGYIAVGTDISQQVMLEEQIRRAKNMADAHALARATFIANVSHEIRTPLTGVLGAAELLKSMALGEQAQEYVHTILACSGHLLSLLNDVLDLSRIDSHKLALEEQVFDVRQLLSECLSSAKTLLPKEHVEARLHVADPVPTYLYGDVTRLRQILFNLLNNAMRFTQHGAVTLHARRESGETPHPRVRFEVQDTGIGVDTEHLDRLFEPFVQAEIDTSHKYGGSGLGLAIVKRLVGLMNGEVGAHSAVGEGSTFWVALPFREPEVVEVSSDESSEEYISPLADARILLVEDSPVTQRLTSRILEKAGCAVTIAGNGVEALEELAAQNFDLVLMDCRMPVMDGLTATRELRQREIGRRTPIIAVTADAFEEHRRECLAAGMDDYLRKPLHKVELYRKVAAHLQR